MKVPSFKDVRAPAGAVLSNWPILLAVSLVSVMLLGLLMSGEPVLIEQNPLDIPAPEVAEVDVVEPTALRGEDLNQRAQRVRAEALDAERRARTEQAQARRAAAEEARRRATALAQAQERLAALRARASQPSLPSSPSDPIDVVASSSDEAAVLERLRVEDIARQVGAYRMPAVVSSARGIGERQHAISETPPIVRRPPPRAAPVVPVSVQPIRSGRQGFPGGPGRIPVSGPDDDEGFDAGVGIPEFPVGRAAPRRGSVAPRSAGAAGAGAGAGEDAGAEPRDGVIIFPDDGTSYRLYEGVLIPAVLQNQIDGDYTGDVSATVSRHVYSADRQRVLVPRGTVALGTTNGVESLWQGRLPVAFHRLIFPDGSWVRMEFNGLNGVGEGSLKDLVDRHYIQLFGAAGGVGLLAGFSQQGGSGAGGGSNFRSAAGEQIASAALNIVSQFLNRLPTITIRAGHRINIRLMSDLIFPREAVWNVE